MLRAGQTLQLPLRSPAMVFHVIEGGITVLVDSDNFTLVQADTCCAPGFAPVTLRNSSATDGAFVFIADETPLHQKLGVFEVRSWAGLPRAVMYLCLRHFLDGWSKTNIQSGLASAIATTLCHLSVGVFTTT